MKRPNPWFTASLLGLAALVPFTRPSLTFYRILARPEMTKVFVAPFRGRPKVALWVKPESLNPVLPEPTPEPSAPPASGPPQIVQESKPEQDSGWIPPKPAIPDGETPLPSASFLEDSSGALKPFYEALARTQNGQGVVRISHFGDSPVTGDLITGEARARFQKLYGDAGHGWILPGRPWEWYGHLGVSLESRGWRMHNAATNGKADHAYGFGGVSFTSSGGASTKLKTSKQSPFNQLELHFMAHPKGGTVEVKVDDETSEISTAAPEAHPARKLIKLASDEGHTVTLRPKGDGEVTIFGMVLEREASGVVYDAVGINGGAIHHLTLASANAWTASLRLRGPDLVILAFGTNEAGYVNIPGTGYEADYREVVRRIRSALPGVAILIMAPMDRDERNQAGEITTMPSIPRIVEAQRKLAKELGCAFFDTYRAMGGKDAAARWYRADPRLMTGDFTHPTRTGSDRVARLLVDALKPKPAEKRVQLEQK